MYKNALFKSRKRQKIDGNIITNVRNLFRLKKIDYTAIKDIKNIFRPKNIRNLRRILEIFLN